MALLAAPGFASADGGGPVLILAGPMVFLVAQAWIIAIEIFVLRRVAPTSSFGESWNDVVAANLRSYVQVGILLPLAITVATPLIGGALGFLAGKLGFPAVADHAAAFAAGLGGWIYDSEDAVSALPYGVVAWFIATFFLSVRVEGKVLQNRWAARGFTTAVAPMNASWLMNAASYAGLTAGVVWIVVKWTLLKQRG